MKKSSPSPATALRRPRAIQPLAVVAKNSPVAAVRRTSSGHELHDQLRKSPTTFSQLPSGFSRKPVFSSSPSSASQVTDEAVPRPTAASVFSPAPLKAATGLSPFVPDLSLIFSEPNFEEEEREEPTVLVSVPVPPATYDAFLLQRIQQQETEILRLRTQLQYYMHVHEETVSAESTRECCDTSSQTEATPSVDASTLTDAPAVPPVPPVLVEEGVKVLLPPQSLPQLIGFPRHNSPSSERMPFIQPPAPFAPSDISIACNNLAQKYLDIELSKPSLHPARPTLMPTHAGYPTYPTHPTYLGYPGYTVQEGGFSIATQNYLERHRLTDRPCAPSARPRPRLCTESIVEWNEEEEGEEERPNGGEVVWNCGTREPSGFPVGFPSRKQPLFGRQSNRSPGTDQKGTPYRSRVDDLDLEELRNLPKLLPKKSSSPLA